VRHGVNGLLVPPGDAAGLGKAAGRLLRDPALARAMGRAGRELVRGAFSVDHMVEGNLAVYRELVGRDGRALA
jgi:glycosyltransferase involved in cell wall biosynthesis